MLESDCRRRGELHFVFSSPDNKHNIALSSNYDIRMLYNTKHTHTHTRCFYEYPFEPLKQSNQPLLCLSVVVDTARTHTHHARCKLQRHFKDGVGSADGEHQSRVTVCAHCGIHTELHLRQEQRPTNMPEGGQAQGWPLLTAVKNQEGGEEKKKGGRKKIAAIRAVLPQLNSIPDAGRKDAVWRRAPPSNPANLICQPLVNQGR